MKQKKLMAMLLGIGLSAGGIGMAAEEAPKAVPPQTVSDAGVEAVREAQEAPAPVPQKKITPEKVLKKIAKDKKWREGWDTKKKRYIAIVSEVVNTSNPESDPDFLTQREAAVRRAILLAKAEIIEYCNTDMEAKDQLHIPGSKLNEKFDAELKNIEANLVEEKEKLAKVLEQYNRAEAEKLRGTTFSDRLDDMMAAVIKKLDESYNKDAKNQQLKAQLDEAKKNLDNQKAQIRRLEKEAEAVKGSLTMKQTSFANTLASMPLYGTTVLYQLEGFDGKNYKIAIMLTWSAALERAARAIVTGEPFKLAPKPNALSLDDWLEKQNLASMVGPRTYIDKDGNRWFLGISAQDCNDDMGSTEIRKAKLFAEQFAKTAAAFSLMGDVESYKSAQLEARTYKNGKGPERGKAAFEVEAKISQSLQTSIRGLQKVASDTVEHSISNREIYVAVYAIDAESAQDALQNEKRNYATKVQHERYKTVEKGRKAANKAAVEAAKNRPEDFQKGYSQQTQALTQELQKREAEKQKAGLQIKQTNQPAPQKTPAGANKGIFGGDVDVSDDF